MGRETGKIAWKCGFMALTGGGGSVESPPLLVVFNPGNPRAVMARFEFP